MNHPADASALAEIDRYFDTAPRTASRPEPIGPLTLFVGTGPWRYYARPSPDGTEEVTVADVRHVMARQRSLGLPIAFEWIRERTPAMADVARAAGLTVHFRPLLALAEPSAAPAVPGIVTRRVDADDPALPAALTAIEAGFSVSTDTAGSPVETAFTATELHRRVLFARELMSRGALLYVVAESGGTPVAGGSAAPRGTTAELTGIATRTRWRRRGIGALVTAALVAEAEREGARTVFLSAGTSAAARMYESVGFSRIGWIGEAVR